MSDGANLGVSAKRALGTILGDEPQPSDDERVSMAELEKRIRSRPLPGDGTKPWDAEDTDDAYSIASEVIAHAFLVLADENPSLLTEQRFYTGDELDASYGADSEPARDWRKNMAGKPREANDAMWEAFQESWPEGNDWIGGATGFMVGWAFNAVRSIKGVPPASNPAIVTVGERS